MYFAIWFLALFSATLGRLCLTLSRIGYVILGLILIIFAGLRNVDVSADYDVYEARFQEIVNHYNEGDLVTIILNSGEPIFTIISVAVSSIDGGIVLLMLTYSFIAISIKLCFYWKLSLYPWLSLLLYISHLFLHTEMIQIRAGLATGILLFAIAPMINHNIIKFTVIVLFASLAHIFALAFLIAYPFYKFSKEPSNKFIFTIAVICIASVLINVPDLINVILDGSSELFTTYYSWERYNYSLGIFNPVFVKQVIVLFMLYAYKQIIFAKIGSLYYGLTSIYLLSTIFLFVFRDLAALGARGASFFNFIDPIILPLIIIPFRNKLIPIVSILLFSLSMLYLNIVEKGVVHNYTWVFE